MKLNAEEKEENLSFDAKSTELVDFIFDERAVRGVYEVIVSCVCKRCV